MMLISNTQKALLRSVVCSSITQKERYLTRLMASLEDSEDLMVPSEDRNYTLTELYKREIAGTTSDLEELRRLKESLDSE